MNTKGIGLICLLAAATAVVSRAQTYTALYTFTGGTDGGYPQYGRLAVDAAGNLYGAATFGGNVNCPIMTSPGPGCGVVFKVNPATNQETVLYTFEGGADGAQPWGGVTLDNAGNVYGTAVFGGSSGLGVVYEVDPSGLETVLHAFNGTHGANPTGDLIKDAAGNLYGTTITGGVLQDCHASGCGEIFRMFPSSAKFEPGYAFTGPGKTDGANPTHGLIRDAAGNLYGTTENGGLPDCLSNEGFQPIQTFVGGCGTVFKTDGKGRETVLYSFGAPPDGADPRGALIRDAAGNLYGTTFYGGLYRSGTVFKIDSTGQETVLYNFQGSTDGANPWGSLVEDAAGNLYGTTNHAGGPCYCGTVFQLDAQGNFTVLHTFQGSDGQYPEAPLLLYKGALYGTTSGGGMTVSGVGGTGTVFKISLP